MANQPVTNNGSVTTTNATPTPIIYCLMPVDGTCQTKVKIWSRATDNNCKYFEAFFTIKMVSGAMTVVVALTNIASNQYTLGALLWDLDLSLDASRNLVVSVKGAAGKTIEWVGALDGNIMT